jgi:hypothetical protein
MWPSAVRAVCALRALRRQPHAALQTYYSVGIVGITLGVASQLAPTLGRLTGRTQNREESMYRRVP